MKFYDGKIWEGRYVDLWTVPHLLIGVLFAFVALINNFSIHNSFYILIFVAVLWEIFEIKFNLKEQMGNRIVDIFIAITGFYLLVSIVKKWGIGIEQLNISFYITVLVYFVINLIGWIAYRKRRQN